MFEVRNLGQFVFSSLVVTSEAILFLINCTNDRVYARKPFLIVSIIHCYHSFILVSLVANYKYGLDTRNRPETNPLQ